MQRSEECSHERVSRTHISIILLRQGLMNFSDLQLCEQLQRSVRELGYTTPTPIQLQAIPPILEGRDIFGCAQTGTGKTAAFALPILDVLADGFRKGPRALILAPTRELAVQISESFTAYGKYMKFKQVVIFGGVSQRPQVEAVRRGVDVIIATPGRLLDLIEQRVVFLDRVETLVLDEADRMLDMGFIHPIRQIVKLIPEDHQTLFFSATVPSDIRSLADSMLTNPVSVSVTPVSSTTESVEQRLYMVHRNDKRDLLTHLLNEELEGSVLVFTRTKRGADRVVKDLKAAGIRADALHGDKSQDARQRALRAFKNRQTRVLVATDIASRGIDVSELPYVVNYDVPETPETYVHRIGRTGRAGLSGIAITLADREEAGDVRAIERLTKTQIPRVAEHQFSSPDAEFDTSPVARQARRGQRHSYSGGKTFSPPRFGRARSGSPARR